MMRGIISILLLLLLLSACQKKGYLFTSFHEPADQGLRLLSSKDGKHWKDLDTILLKPSIGTQKVLRDPSMVLGGDRQFHLVWTSSWKNDKGFGYAASSDLIHWSDPKHLPVMEKESTTVNVWAPELFFDNDSDRYIIVWASCIPGRFERGMEADSNNHRLYYTTTKDFKQFSETKLFFDPGYSVIDAVIVKKGNLDYVLIFKDNTRPNRFIRIARSASPLGPWTSISEGLTDKFTEGPSVCKIGTKWFIYVDSYDKKKYVALSTNDFVHFKNEDEHIQVPIGHKHGTIVALPLHKWKQVMTSLQKK